VFRDALDRCAEILQPRLGLDVREPLLADPDDSAAAEILRRTTVTQPALFAVELAMAELWKSWGVRPVALAGHSIGEYVAACLAGVMSEEDALALVAERGRLMGSLPPGAMLAVHLPEAELAARLAAHPELSLAVVNGPSACVASGPEPAIARLEDDLVPAGTGCRRLRTSHAFHSSMMDPVLAAFEESVRRIPLRAPAIPFLSNVNGTWITGEDAADPGYWVRHLRGTVRWGDNARALAEDPSRVLLEVGPGNVLTQLVRAAGAAPVPSLPDPAGEEDARRQLLRAAGRVWCAGVDVDWRAVHGTLRRRVPLPTYPFERRRHWIDADPAASRAGATGTAATGKNPDRAAWFWIPGWRRARIAARRPVDAEPSWLVLDDGSPLARELAGLGEVRGARVVTVRAGAELHADGDAWTLDPARPEHFEELLRRLQDEDALPRRVVHLWCAAPDGPDRAIDLGFHALVRLLRAFGQQGATEDVRIVAAARSLFDVAGERVSAPERAVLVGVCRVAPQEYAGLSCRLVDLPEGDDSGGAAALARELDLTDREPVAAWRGGHRWVPSTEAVRIESPDPPPAPIREDGVYLLTGGMGPLETAVARRLAECGAHAVGFLEAGTPDDEAVSDLRRTGIEVLLWRAGGPDGAKAAVAELRERFDRVDAVFHTAGEIGGGMIQLKEAEDAERILAPRLAAGAVAELLRAGEELILFSSGISRTGVFGQVDYCAACAYLDALAQSRRDERGPRVRALDWGMAHWDRWRAAAGPGADALTEQLRTIQEEVGIEVEEGVDALWRALSEDAPEIVISTQDLDEVIAQARNASVSDVLEGVGGAGGAAGGAGGALESATEARIAALWTELLGVGDIGRRDSFFDLGGNSLLAIQLASRLRKSFDIELPIATLFESADLAALAAAVDAALEERRAAEEIARLLDEIEALPEDEVRAQLDRDADARGSA
jgi:acyl transferase domain-containing protein